jgi:hypothetical protein
MTTSDAPVPSRKRRAVLVVSVAAVLVLGAIAASLLWLTDGSTDDSDADVVTETVPPPEAVPFHDPQGAYTLDVDRRWTAPTSVGDIETWSLRAPHATAPNRLTIETRPAHDLDLNEFLQLLIREARAKEGYSLREFRVVTPEPHDNTAAPAARPPLGVVAYDAGNGNDRRTYFLVVGVDGTNAVVATLDSDRDRAARGRAAVEPYLLTLRPA